MAKASFETVDEAEDEAAVETPVATPVETPPKPRTRKPRAKAKAVSTRRLTAKTKYQTVLGIVGEEDKVTEKTTVGALLAILKERVFEEAVG
jgi:hypothetical protein